MSSTKLKPLVLMDIFRQFSGPERRFTVPELAEELRKRGIKAERKGIYRDIDALREYGADIRHSGGGYYLAHRDFSLDDLQALAWAVRSAYFISRRRADELTEKLRALAGECRAKKLIQGGMAGEKWPDGELLIILGILDEAIALRRQVTFTLRGGIRGGRRFRISPYAIIYAGRGCFLAGNMEGADNVSLIPMEKINRVRPDMTPWRHFSEVSPYRAEFDCLDFMGSISEFPDENWKI